MHRQREHRPAMRPAVTVGALTLLTLLGSMAGFPSSARAQVGGGAGIQDNVQYGQAEGQSLVMDVYIPNGSGPFPAIVMIHGGGFIGGDKDLNTSVSMRLAQAGFAVFNINYRLAPRFPYPAAVKDAETAVRFVRGHASEYGIDPARIAAFGSSAGGTIAVSVGAQGMGTTGSKVMAVVSWSGSLDMPLNYQLRSRDQRVEDGLSGYIGMPGADLTTPSATKKLDEASPINLITKDAPPMLIVNARVEFEPIQTADAFVAQAEKLGLTVVRHTPPMGHALRYSREALPATTAFLDQYLTRATLPTESPRPTTEPSTTPQPTTAPASSKAPLLPVFLAIAAVLIIVVTVAALRTRRRKVPHGY